MNILAKFHHSEVEIEMWTPDHWSILIAYLSYRSGELKSCLSFFLLHDVFHYFGFTLHCNTVKVIWKLYSWRTRSLRVPLSALFKA